MGLYLGCPVLRNTPCSVEEVCMVMVVSPQCLISQKVLCELGGDVSRMPKT